MARDRLNQLITAWMEETATREERRELVETLLDETHAETVRAQILQHLQERDFVYEGDLTELYARIADGVHHQVPVRKLGWWKYVAAAVIFFAVAGTWLLLQPKTPALLTQAERFHNDVAPGREGARLKLSGGRVVDLSTAREGLIAIEGGYSIYKENGQIVYKGTAGATKETIYNELIADRKERSSAILPDGSIAWVNAASSVRYPVQFSGNERKVTMTGEAIFRVVHNEKQPFRVYVGGQVFEDVGTEFNINAYSDEAEIQTTVMEGSVRIDQTLIRPGQQARVTGNGSIQVAAVDTDPVFAWRNGQFEFSSMSIEGIMKQAARWYDVDVVFEGKIDQKYIISADRNRPISDLLKKIEQAGGVHFEIEGRKVTVRP